jgi:hypothetical protein
MPAPTEHHREWTDTRKLAGLRLISAATRLIRNGVVFVEKASAAQRRPWRFLSSQLARGPGTRVPPSYVRAGGVSQWRNRRRQMSSAILSGEPMQSRTRPEALSSLSATWLSDAQTRHERFFV